MKNEDVNEMLRFLIAISAVILVFVLFFEFFWELDPIQKNVLFAVNFTILIILWIELLWRIVHSHDKFQYIKTHWFDVIITLPIFDVFRVGELAKVFKGSELARLAQLGELSKLDELAKVAELSRIDEAVRIAKIEKLAELRNLVKETPIVERSFTMLRDFKHVEHSVEENLKKKKK